MPLTAVISDIHGNHAGLLCALRDAEAKGCSRIVCLGDLVEGGPHNEEVVQEIIRRGILAVQGPCDRKNDAVLSRGAFEFLERLPLSHVEGKTLFTHLSPREKPRSLLSPYEAWNVFDEFDYRMIFVGHLHVPALYGERNEDKFSARAHKVQYGAPCPLQWNDRYIVSVGAVGYPRDGLKKIRYVIYDDDAHTLEFRAVEGPLLAPPAEDALDF